MRLLALNLENFRNAKAAQFSFRGDRVFFLGSNGQGKTNLLEAIGMSATLRSFRKSGMESLVRDGANLARLFFRFSDEDGSQNEVILSFRSKGEKNLEVDGQKISRLGDYLGRFPAVALSYRDFRLVREGPSDRRKWLDLLLSSASRAYFSNLQSFHRALRERNALLKKTGSSDSELGAFEQELAKTSVQLHSHRSEAIPLLAESMKGHYAKLSGDAEAVGMRYLPDLPNLSVEEMISRYADDRERDRLLGMTRHGPHRDDLAFSINEQDARSHASEGQQRGIVLALRLAEFFYLKKELRRIPLLLADDVLGELDQSRKANFRKLLPPQAQVFATGTSFPSPGEEAIWETYKVLAGRLCQS